MFRWWFDKKLEFSKGGFSFAVRADGGGFNFPKGLIVVINTLKKYNGHLTSISANKLIQKYV